MNRMETSNADILKDIVMKLLEKMDFQIRHIEISPLEETQETLLCSVRVEENQHFLIGQYGANLAAVQHLVRSLFRKQTGESINVIIDVNDYFMEKKSTLEREAKKAVDEVLLNNISVALRPMLPYERKIIHSYLHTDTRVFTESVGKGTERKIMVRPKPVADESPAI